jgi:hypothetical protein
MMRTCEPLRIPSLDGATEWLNTEPLDSAERHSHVLLVNFWTFTCINWLHQCRTSACGRTPTEATGSW